MVSDVSKCIAVGASVGLGLVVLVFGQNKYRKSSVLRKVLGLFGFQDTNYEIMCTTLRPEFEKVKNAFEQNFKDGRELGAQLVIFHSSHIFD